MNRKNVSSVLRALNESIGEYQPSEQLEMIGVIDKEILKGKSLTETLKTLSDNGKYFLTVNNLGSLNNFFSDLAEILLIGMHYYKNKPESGNKSQSGITLFEEKYSYLDSISDLQDDEELRTLKRCTDVFKLNFKTEHKVATMNKRLEQSIILENLSFKMVVKIYSLLFIIAK